MKNIEVTTDYLVETEKSKRCKEIRKTIQGVWRLWLKHPDMRLGQLMLNFCVEKDTEFYAVTDKEVRDRIQKV